MDERTWTLSGFDAGSRHCVTWTGAEPGQMESLGQTGPRCIVLLSHGYAEHVGRYRHVAQALVDVGAVVYGIDHVGHGRSEGDRAVIVDFDGAVADLHQLDRHAREEWPGLPVVLVGHSMGGLIALRYAQEHGRSLVALVLSGPQLGGAEMLTMLLGLPEIPSFPIDPTVLSRDPAVGEDYLADPLVWHGDLQRPMIEAMVAAAHAVELGARLTSLPVLWLHGSEDQLSAIDGARVVLEAKVGKQLQQQRYDGAKHEIFNETNQDDVLADVTRFIDSVLAESFPT